MLGGACFSRVKVSDPPGSGKDPADQVMHVGKTALVKKGEIYEGITFNDL